MTISRGLGLLPDPHDDRDLRFSRVASAALGLMPLPPVVDLRPRCSPVRDQGHLGSCTAQSGVGFREALAVIATGAYTPLSPLWLYYEERKGRHRVRLDSGAPIRDCLKVLCRRGCAPEVEWPYNPAEFATEPTVQADIDALAWRIGAYHRVNNLLEVKQALVLEQPVVLGIQVFASFTSDAVEQTGVVPLPNPNAEEWLGGHALCVVGYDDAASQLILRNSWGQGFGDRGYVYLPYDYMNPTRQLVMDMWTGGL